MRKFTFLIILLLIIFYGIFSNYKSKIDRNAANFVNSQKDSNTKKEFGCTNDGGIISSSYCRFSEKNCREYFLSEYFGYLNNEEITHCTSYKVGVDEEGYDVIMKIISDKEKINPKGYINAGFFVLNKQIFKYLDKYKNPIWEREPLEQLAKSNQLVSFKHKGYWRPVDTTRDKEDLEKEIIKIL